MLVVLGLLIKQECDGGKRWWSWLSRNTLCRVFTSAAVALHVLSCGEENIVPGMGIVGRGRLEAAGSGRGTLQVAWGGGELQAERGRGLGLKAGGGVGRLQAVWGRDGGGKLQAEWDQAGGGGVSSL